MSSSASVPTATVYGARERTANEARRSVAPTRAATPAAAITRFSALSVPPKAAVTLATRASGGQRKPRGATATGIGEL